MTLRIGITSYPNVGGSGVIATELGLELAKLGHEIHFISYEQPFRLNGEKKNVTFHQVPINEYSLFKYPDYTLPLSVKMAEVSEQFHLDILHVHYAVPHATAAILARNLIGKNVPKVITTLHGTDITLLGEDPSFQPIIQYSMEHSCGVTAVSEYLKNKTLQRFKLSKPIEVIHNFVAVKKPTKDPQIMKQELGILENEKVIIHMSNIRPLKRIPDLLRVFAEVSKTTQVKLLILSGGDFTPYESLVNELHIRDKIVIKEWVNDIENYLQIANLLLHTSENESFGLSILEALSFGIPVVATKAGGVVEVMKDGETGFLCEIGDINYLATSVKKILKDEVLAKTIGEKSLQYVQENFSSETIVKKYLDYYYKILKDDCPR